MGYLKNKKGSLESSIISVWTEAAKKTEGNAFGMALQQAKEKGEKTFTVAGKEYDVKKEQEKMDKVNKVALGKKFKDRKDKDIDNDGDVDDSDKYLHKRRQAVSKAIKKENYELTKAQKKLPPALQKAIKKKEKNENYEVGTKERRDHTIETTPGQSKEDFEKQVEVMHKKKNSMREALAKMWGIEEKNNRNPFDKKEEKKYNKDKKEGRTMTGKPETKVEVEPEVNEKKK